MKERKWGEEATRLHLDWNEQWGPTFVIDDQDHQKIIEIHAKLHKLLGLMHDTESIPCMNFFLHDVEEEELKVIQLCCSMVAIDPC